tara:strand:- start:1803 stop:2513 length:711 start_codon:yes stop_codon:yes gene_type:complete
MASFNLGQAFQGALPGAAAGSFGGPLGSAVGGLFGGLTGGFGGGSKPEQMQQLPTMSPEQQQQLQQLMQMLAPEGQLGQGYGQGLQQLMEMMDPSSEAQQRFADPMMQQFNQQTIPGIAERFAGGAQGGALSSSGFGQALGGAASGLQSNLAALKSQLQQGAIKDIMQQYGNASTSAMNAQPFGYYQKPAQQGMGSSLLQGYSQAGFPGFEQLGGMFKNMFSKPGQSAPNQAPLAA